MGVTINPYNSNMANYNYFSSEPQTGPTYYVPEPWRITSVPHHFPEHHYPLEHTRHNIARTLSNLGHAVVHPWEDGTPVHSPRTDVRESEANYYVDVELPGVESRDRITLKWVSSRTLLLEARVQRPLTGEEDGKAKLKEEARSAKDRPAEAEAGTEKDGGKLTRTFSTEEKERAREEFEPATNTPAETKAQSEEDGGKLTRILSTKEMERAREGDESVKSAELPKSQQKVFLTLKERQVGMFARAYSFPTAVNHATIEAHLGNGLLRFKVPKVMDEPVKEEHKMPEIKEGAMKDERVTI